MRVRHLLVMAALLLVAPAAAMTTAGTRSRRRPRRRRTPVARRLRPAARRSRSACSATARGRRRSSATNLCPGFLDYIDLVNTTKGGVDSHPIEVIDIDHAYEVPKAVAGYEQMQQKGVVAVLCYGTPIAVGLNELVTRDKIAVPHAGLRHRPGRRSAKLPVPVPGGRELLLAGRRRGRLRADARRRPTKPKIAYLYYDNPAGQEPLPVLEELADAGKLRAARRSRCPPPASTWPRRSPTSPSATRPTS